MRIVTLLLILHIKASAAIVPTNEFLTLIPSASPAATTSDAPSCDDKKISTYYNPPTPTGSLQSALLSYSDELIQACTSSDQDQPCPSPPKSSWCAFTNVAPSTILADYSAYGSSAYSWWSERSSLAVDLAADCPRMWYEYVKSSTEGQSLYDTIVMAECFEEAALLSGPLTTADPTTRPLTAGPTATSRSGVTAVTAAASSASLASLSSVSTSVPVATKVLNGVLGRAGSIDFWMVAGTGFAVAAMLLC